MILVVRACSNDRFDYLAQRLGFDLDVTFRFDRFTDEARRELRHWNLDRLVTVYQQRHAIVHRDERPLKAVKELEEFKEVLGKLIIDLTAQAQAMHKVESDASASLAKLVAVAKGNTGTSTTT